MFKNNSLKELASLFASTSDEKTVQMLFQLFFTPSERDFLSMRNKIVKELLVSGLPQREIAKKISVSISKITAGSKELQQTPTVLKDYLRKFYKNNP